VYTYWYAIIVLFMYNNNVLIFIITREQILIIIYLFIKYLKIFKIKLASVYSKLIDTYTYVKNFPMLKLYKNIYLN
jgi:hypothetical protein